MSTFVIAYGPLTNRRYAALAEGSTLGTNGRRPIVWTRDVASAEKHATAEQAEAWAARWLTPGSYAVVPLMPDARAPEGGVA